MADYWKLEAKKTYPVVENGQCVLTPIYDMVNTEVHGFRDILALPMNENSSPNPSMRSVVEFFEKYMDRKEMREMARDIRQNLTRTLDLVLPLKERETGEPGIQQRAVFRQSLEKSILGRIEPIENIK
jgi:hypothetical protein